MGCAISPLCFSKYKICSNTVESIPPLKATRKRAAGSIAKRSAMLVSSMGWFFIEWFILRPPTTLSLEPV